MSIAERLKRSCLRCESDRRRKSSPYDPNFAERCARPADPGIYAIKNGFLSCHDLLGSSLTLRHAVQGVGIPKAWFVYRDSDGNEYIGDKQLSIDEPPATAALCIRPKQQWLFRLTAVAA